MPGSFTTKSFTVSQIDENATGTIEYNIILNITSNTITPNADGQFVYSLKLNGNAILGIIALFGVILVHLATNLIDDYFDYKILIKDEKYINSAQNLRAVFYILSGQTLNSFVIKPMIPKITNKAIIIIANLLSIIVQFILFSFSSYILIPPFI